ncbi:MAG: hypothetical protein ACRYFS_00760 [Janthinobacterium lividum]
MQTAERLGMLGALATAVTVPFALCARRKARQEMEREETTRLCASRLSTLGDALHAYRQDHGGELPRKFICPPNSLRLVGRGWSADWNEASLSDYITDLDVYSCPCGGAYFDRVPLLLRDGPQQLMRPEPQSVVLYCRHHAKWGGNDRWGEFLVLRLDGSVERIPASEAEFWRYADGRWYAPDEEPSEGAHIFTVFPGEPWPPHLASVCDRPWWPGDGEINS